MLKCSEKAKVERKGSGNPMYGKDSWNKGLTKENSEILFLISKNRLGTTFSEETKKKQSDSAKKREIHGHTGKKHTEETKQVLRDKTLANIKKGIFKHTKTKPHICLASILEELDIKYEEEKILDKWCFDFYLIDYDIYLEADGDYFHSNPKRYPNGPESKTQKRNNYRDNIKNSFCKEKKITCKRFWESDILNKRNKVKNEINKLIKSKKS